MVEQLCPPLIALVFESNQQKTSTKDASRCTKNYWLFLLYGSICDTQWYMWSHLSENQGYPPKCRQVPHSFQSSFHIHLLDFYKSSCM